MERFHTLDSILSWTVRIACTRLQAGLVDRLGDRLIWLAAYGSSTRPDGPKCLADLDTHAILADEPSREIAARILVMLATHRLSCLVVE